MPCKKEVVVYNRSLRLLLCDRGQRFSTSVHSHLHLQRPSLYLRNALGDDKGDAIAGAAGYLGEVPAEQLQTALQLLMATLDGQSL